MVALKPISRLRYVFIAGWAVFGTPSFAETKLSEPSKYDIGYFSDADQLKIPFETNNVGTSTNNCFSGFELRIFSAPWCKVCKVLKGSLKNDGRLSGERGSFSVYSSGKEIKIPIRIITLENQEPDAKAWEKLQSAGLSSGMLPEIVLLKNGLPYANPLIHKSTLRAMQAAENDARPEVKKDSARIGIAWGYRSPFLDPVLIESFSRPILSGTPKDPLKSKAIQKTILATCRDTFERLTTSIVSKKMTANEQVPVKSRATSATSRPAL